MVSAGCLPVSLVQAQGVTELYSGGQDDRHSLGDQLFRHRSFLLTQYWMVVVHKRGWGHQHFDANNFKKSARLNHKESVSDWTTQSLVYLDRFAWNKGITTKIICTSHLWTVFQSEYVLLQQWGQFNTITSHTVWHIMTTGGSSFAPSGALEFFISPNLYA